MRLVNAEYIPYKDSVIKLLTIVKDLFYDGKITEKVTQWKVKRDVYKVSAGFKISTKFDFNNEFTLFKRYNDIYICKVRYLNDCLYLTMMNYNMRDNMSQMYVKNNDPLFSNYFYKLFKDLHDTLLKEFPEECKDFYDVETDKTF